MTDILILLNNIAVVLSDFNYISIAVRIILSVILSGIIGWERTKSGRAAGLRTHIIVCLGACVVSLTGIYLHNKYGTDPSRIAAQVISGIGFLGTGTILIKNQSEIVGLTTAACIWSTGCVGVALGYGLYWVALLASVLCFIIVKKFVFMEQNIKFKDTTFSIYVELKNATETNAFFEDMEALDIDIQDIKFTNAKSKSTNSIAFSAFVDTRGKNKKEIIQKINNNAKTHFAVATE